MSTAERRAIQRELKDLRATEREIEKPLRAEIKLQREALAVMTHQLRDNERILNREIKRVENAAAGIRRRRAILEGRLG